MKAKYNLEHRSKKRARTRRDKETEGLCPSRFGPLQILLSGSHAGPLLVPPAGPQKTAFTPPYMEKNVQERRHETSAFSSASVLQRGRCHTWRQVMMSPLEEKGALHSPSGDGTPQRETLNEHKPSCFHANRSVSRCSQTGKQYENIEEQEEDVQVNHLHVYLIPHLMISNHIN